MSKSLTPEFGSFSSRTRLIEYVWPPPSCTFRNWFVLLWQQGVLQTENGLSSRAASGVVPLDAAATEAGGPNGQETMPPWRSAVQTCSFWTEMVPGSPQLSATKSSTYRAATRAKVNVWDGVFCGYCPVKAVVNAASSLVVVDTRIWKFFNALLPLGALRTT
jgi:hypothetical protein